MEGLLPHAIRMIAPGIPGAGAEALARLRPDGICVDEGRGGGFLPRERVRIHLGKGPGDVKSEHGLFEPTLASHAPLVHEVSDGSGINFTGGRSTFRWGVNTDRPVTVWNPKSVPRSVSDQVAKLSESRYLSESVRM